MSENVEHTIELPIGCTIINPKTKKETFHSEVTFGKRLTVKDLIALDNDPQAQNPTQYQDLLRRKMITKFGTLTMPVPLNVLLGLDVIDREDLEAAGNEFLRSSRGECTAEIRENHEVKLYFGFEIDGTLYDVVQFGNRITGKDEAEADVFGNGNARLCFLIGRQISRLSTSDGLASIEGKVAIENFNSLDAEDFNLLRTGAEMWKLFFRYKGKTISGKRDGGSSVSISTRNETDGKGDIESAEGTD